LPQSIIVVLNVFTTNSNSHEGIVMTKGHFVEFHFLILELHFFIFRESDSREEQGGEQLRINSKVIPRANECGERETMESGFFLAPSS
jgi:hypothetical protein